MLGIDVSVHQGAFDWDAAKAAGVGFAWCKASEGATVFDRQYIRNMREARRVGIPVGAYHYAYPTGEDAREEAAHFLSVIGKPKDGDLLPVLDFEAPEARRLGPKALTAWALEWLRIVEDALHVKPIFYSYPSYIIVGLDGAGRLDEYPLWLADYGPNDGHRHALGSVSRLFFGHFNIVAHQYTSEGRIGGKRVDLNHADDLERLRVRYEPVEPTKRRKPLPGPRRKPKWFWRALKEYLARRKGEA